MKVEESALVAPIINLCRQILMSEDRCNLFSTSCKLQLPRSHLVNDGNCGFPGNNYYENHSNIFDDTNLNIYS